MVMNGVGKRLAGAAWKMGVVARSSVMGRGICLMLCGGWLWWLNRGLSEYAGGGLPGGWDSGPIVAALGSPSNLLSPQLISLFRSLGFRFVILPMCVVLGSLVVVSALQVAWCYAWKGRAHGEVRDMPRKMEALVGELSIKLSASSTVMCWMVRIGTIIFLSAMLPVVVRDLVRSIWDGANAFGVRAGGWGALPQQILFWCSAIMVGLGCLWMCAGALEMILLRSKYHETAELEAHNTNCGDGGSGRGGGGGGCGCGGTLIALKHRH